jgi:hypothetical protein
MPTTAPLHARLSLIAPLVCALALATPLGAAAQATGAAAAAPAASAPVDALRAELFPLVTAAQDLLKNQQYDAALKRLQETDAVPARSAYETYVIERLRLAAAAGTQDVAQVERSFNLIANDARLAARERAELGELIMVMHYRAKDHARTISWAQRTRADAAASPAMKEQARKVLISAQYASQDWASAARELLAEVQAQEAAGSTPGEDRLRLLISSQALLKDLDGYLATAEKLVRHHPKPEYWQDLLLRLPTRAGFADRLNLDLLRLKAAAIGLDDPADLLDAAAQAQEAGLAVEASKLMAQGYARGLFGKGAQAGAQAKLRDTAARAAADDEAVMRGKGPAPRTALAMATWGMNYMSAGQTERGAALIEEALAKGGLKNPEDVRLRLGAQYALAGQTDKAERTLAAVQGRDGTADLARLWRLQLQQRKTAK